MSINNLDVSGCDYLEEQTTMEEHGFIKNNWCVDYDCECSQIDIEECSYKAVALCKQKDAKIKKLKDLLARRLAAYQKQRKALEEINELAEKECQYECDFKWCRSNNEDESCVLYKIKNKINEVKKNG